MELTVLLRDFWRRSEGGGQSEKVFLHHAVAELPPGTYPPHESCPDYFVQECDHTSWIESDPSLVATRRRMVDGEPSTPEVDPKRKCDADGDQRAQKEQTA
jgi:hypothetical protein